MTSNYEVLLEKVHEIDDLNKALSVLGWDREVNMPKAGTAARVQQMTTLSRFTHIMFTADEMGELIEAGVIVVEPIAGDPWSGAVYLKELYQAESGLAKRVQAMHDAAKSVNGEILVLCHGGPISATLGTLGQCQPIDWPALVPGFGASIRITADDRIRLAARVEPAAPRLDLLDPVLALLLGELIPSVVRGVARDHDDRGLGELRLATQLP